MRRSFGANGGMGGGGGGGMLRTVQRAVRAGVSGGASQEPFSHSTVNASASATRPTYRPTTSNVLSLSSSTSPPSFSSFNVPISATSTLPAWASSCSSPTYSDEFDWEFVDGGEEERDRGCFDDSVFGSVPSRDEVHLAVTSLQQVLDPASFSQIFKDGLDSDMDVADQLMIPAGLLHQGSSIRPMSDWIEPSLQLFSQGTMSHIGFDRVYDAFHLLQTEPSIQRMVISLSSDKAVWDAVLNNEAVRELRESLNEAENQVPGCSNGSSDGTDNAAVNILALIFNATKAQVMELFEKISKLLNELFRPSDNEMKTEAAADPLEERLRTSFLLAIVVLLIVVVTRAHNIRS